MQMHYWSAVSLSWYNHITVPHVKPLIQTKDKAILIRTEYHDLSIPPQLHRQSPTYRYTYKSSQGEYGYNGGPEKGKEICRYVTLVTLHPGDVDELLYMLKIKEGKIKLWINKNSRSLQIISSFTNRKMLPHMAVKFNISSIRQGQTLGVCI